MSNVPKKKIHTAASHLDEAVHRGGFASLPSGRFNTLTVVNPPDEKLVKTTPVQCERALLIFKNNNGVIFEDGMMH